MAYEIEYPKKVTEIDIDLLRRSLSYDPVTGQFTWREFATQSGGLRGNRKNKPGVVAGYKSSDGYWRISIFGRKWLGHVLAWAHTHGHIPARDIDHINRNKSDNRIANLRVVTRAQNARNSMRNEQRGTALGTTKAPRGWAAQASNNGGTVFLGNYPTQEDAHKAHLLFVEANGLVAK